MSAYAVSARGLVSRRIPQGVLAPMSALLFGSGEQGAWYDPSDLSALFQDAAGTTPVTGMEQPVGRMLDLSGNGNHASQATTTKRPVVSRRVNLRMPSQAANGLGMNGTSTATISVPGFDGFTDGFSVRETATGGAHSLSAIPVVAGALMRVACIVKDAGRSAVSIADAGADKTVFDLSTKTISGFGVSQAKITELHDGFFLIESTRVWVYTNAYLILLSGGSHIYTGDPAKGIDVAGIDVRLAADAHFPYQWVNTSADYDADPAKFPAYRRLDGVDDSHVSATGGGGTTGFFFSASVTPQGGAGTARTLFSDAGTNTGYRVRLNASNQLELAAGNGTAYTTIATAGTLAVGTTDMVQAWDDGTNLNVKIGNGATASIARPAVSAGTAGYTMGQDTGASTGYFNGRVYSTVYRKDSSPTQSQREAVAVYQRRKAMMP